MSECEIIDLPWLFKDTSKETEEEENETELRVQNLTRGSENTSEYPVQETAHV